MLKRIAGITAAAALVAGLVGVAAAQTGPGYGPGYGMGMGPGRGMGMGGEWGAGNCPGLNAEAATVQTEEQATKIAEEYVAKYLQGYTVERVLPSTGPRGRGMFVVDVKGPKGETRTLHVNPWGGVRPFGPFAMAR